MIKGDLIWFIEHISRELDVAAAVSALFEKETGKKIKVIPYSDFNKARSLNPALVLLPYCYSIKDPMLGKYLKLWPDADYFNLAWEQIFYQANLEYKAPRDEFAKKCVIHHSWSKTRKSFLIGKGVPEKLIFENGHPAFQLYKEPYRRIFTIKNKLSEYFRLDKTKKWLFFPENYSWFFYSDNNLKDIIRHGQSPQVIESMKSYCGQALTIVLRWLSEAAEKNKDTVEIILRPRPAFSLEYFSKKIKALVPEISEKIHIIKDFSVREWILSSDIVVSSFSTSLIEAAIAEKPIYMMDPIPIPKELQAEWYKRIQKIKSQSGFLNILRKENLNRNFLNLNSWAKKEFFVSPDPISGLKDFLVSYEKSKFQTDVKLKSKLINEFKTKLGFRTAVLNLIGSLKRSLFGDKSYFYNDDLKRYDYQIREKLNIFNKLLSK